jgi:hypothetical protein
MTNSDDPNGSVSPARPLLPEYARQACALLGLDPEQSPLRRPGMVAQDFLAALVEQGLLEDAVTFMACALPKREAVWWGYLCARESGHGEAPSNADAAALAAALAWVTEPTDVNRRAAKDAADATEYSTPAGLVAFAAFLSGGSLAPPDVQAVAPEEHLTAQVIRSAVMVAAVIHEPQEAEAHYRAFLKFALDVAQRRLRWEEP